MTVIISLSLVWLDHRGEHLDSIRSGLRTVLSPIVQVVNLPASIYHDLDGWFSSRSELLDENDKLKRSNTSIQVDLQQLIALQTENQVLRSMLNTLKKAKGRRLVAEILSVDGDALKHVIEVNKGLQDEVYKGQPVLDAQGIMGQVIEADMFTSRVLLLTDIQHAIPVKIQRNGIRAIASGTGQANELQILHLPHTTDIQVNDLVLSSGLGKRFPAGFPVGVVNNVTKVSSDSFAKVTLTPIAQLTQSDLLVLIWPDTRQSAESATSQGVQ